ncbi:hypothetical protein [Chachezhania sediminis]|uniref:hypothetical protein n=1 Tax=Chachezhania sediminis TaxID=2599291 RepID=UPI00131CE4E8|nr:hypothetical protein [Chachezhania sediminis]
MPRWIPRIFMILTLAPVVFWIANMGAVMYLAGPNSCMINEGSVTPCLFLGHDIGETAYTMGMIAAWGPLFLFPCVVITGLLWAGVVLLGKILDRRGDA